MRILNMLKRIWDWICLWVVTKAAVSFPLATVHGLFTYEVINPDGSIAASGSFANSWTTLGLNYLLNVGLNQLAGFSAIFMGLIDGAVTPTLAITDTMGTHTGWTENTGYSQNPRPTWTPSGNAAGGVIVNSAVVTFTATGSRAIAGAFLCDSSTVGGTAGTLICTGLAANVQNLVVGQNLNLTYSATLVAG